MLSYAESTTGSTFTTTAISFWESREALEASEQGYYRQAMTEAASQFGQPRRSVYEVIVQA